MAGSVRLSVLVENTAGRADLRPEHGFAVWVESDAGHVLFDTGQGEALDPNAEALGVDLSTADAIVLSHGHYDHTGGLPTALEAAPAATVYAHLAAFDPKYALGSDGSGRAIGMPTNATLALARHPGKLIETVRPTEVLPGFFVTGQVPRSTGFEDVGGPFYLDEACTRPDPLLDDQALYFATTEGIVIVLGCAHAGVINTISHIAAITGDDQTHAVLGGMHLGGASDKRINATAAAFETFKVERLGPAHCTGERALATFRRRFPDRLLPYSAGWSCSFQLLML